MEGGQASGSSWMSAGLSSLTSIWSRILDAMARQRGQRHDVFRERPGKLVVTRVSSSLAEVAETVFDPSRR